MNRISRKVIGKIKLLPPSRIAISVNSICNAHCLMCDIGQKSGGFYDKMTPGGELSLETLIALFDEVMPFKPVIAFNGTEPLLYKHLPEAISEAKARGMTTTVTTNGILLSKRADELIRAGLDNLAVSIDGIPEVNERIRGVKGISKLADAGLAKMYGYCNTRVAFALTNYNDQVLLDTIKRYVGKVDGFTVSLMNYISSDMARAHNMKWSVMFGEVKPSGGLADAKAVFVKSVQQQLTEAQAMWPRFVSLVPRIPLAQLPEWYKTDKPLTDKCCSVAWRNVEILSNGDVTPAARCFNQIMGNINAQPFMDIWKGDRFSEFRRLISKYKQTPACARCCGLYGR